jgi:superfamily II DNA/RNA helicase
VKDISHLIESVIYDGSYDTLSINNNSPNLARLLRALAGEKLTRPLSTTDLAVLVRAAIREDSVQRPLENVELPKQLIDRFAPEDLSQHSLKVSYGERNLACIQAYPWQPNWFLHPDITDLENQLYHPNVLNAELKVKADPVLLRLNYSSYASEAQREAIRTILSAQKGSTIVVLLPTGAGKTLCGLMPTVLPLEFEGHIESDRSGVTPFIVPTVSLAMDLERRIRESNLFPHQTAWRPGTDGAENIRTRILSGIQGPVFAAPEAIVGGLKNTLLRSAEQGFIRFIVIDEAHIVTSWGDEFRPAFQQLATFCCELRAKSPQPFSIVLMSATLTTHALRTLRELFDTGDGFQIVHAVRLRPEPRYAWMRAPSQSKRQEWILDALANLPRPAIVYATRRKDAEGWYKSLFDIGYRRIGLIHGGSSEGERERALEKWRLDNIDLMVATSAFGLGVDKPDVRAVIHATFPESLDRYYQEVGRGGRDGRASLALMVWTDQDKRIARGLAHPTFIGIERGNERWSSMFTSHERKDHGNGKFTVPIDVSPSTRSEDIDMGGEENNRWNQRTLLLLQRSGAITLINEEAVQDNERYRRFVKLKIIEDRHLEEGFWQENVLSRRQELLSAYDQEWSLMQTTIEAKKCIAFTLQDQYQIIEPEVNVVRACGSCPFCRIKNKPSSSGRLILRHTVCNGGEPVTVNDETLLRGMLNDQTFGFIFVNLEDQSPDKMRPLAEWFVRHGIQDLVIDSFYYDSWFSYFADYELQPIFFHNKRISGVRRKFPAAVFFQTVDTSALADGSILVLSSDAREADRQDRRLSDTVAFANWTFHQFMDRYVE